MTDREPVTDLEGRSDEDLVEEYCRLRAQLVCEEFEAFENPKLDFIPQDS